VVGETHYCHFWESLRASFSRKKRHCGSWYLEQLSPHLERVQDCSLRFTEAATCRGDGNHRVQPLVSFQKTRSKTKACNNLPDYIESEKQPFGKGEKRERGDAHTNLKPSRRSLSTLASLVPFYYRTLQHRHSLPLWRRRAHFRGVCACPLPWKCGQG